MADVYVARKCLKVGEQTYYPGDEVPEANSWWHLPTYVHNGSLALVQTSVDYSRGMNQRRPVDPDRADYRVKRERWYGELSGWGKASGPPPASATFVSITPNSVSQAADDVVCNLVWTGDDPDSIGFADASGPGITAVWALTVTGPGTGTWTSYAGFWGNAAGPGSYPVSLWKDSGDGAVEISNQLPFTTTA
jgi:hypothetical protein